MKGISEIQAENNALVRRAENRRAASIRRLKQRIARESYRFGWSGDLSAAEVRKRINAAIDAWCEAERKRGGQ